MTSLTALTSTPLTYATLFRSPDALISMEDMLLSAAKKNEQEASDDADAATEDTSKKMADSVIAGLEMNASLEMRNTALESQGKESELAHRAEKKGLGEEIDQI